MTSNVHYLKTSVSTAEKRRFPQDSYEVFFQQNAAAMYLASIPQGVIENCNEAFVRLLGYESPLEIIGRSLSEFFKDSADYDGFMGRFHNQNRINGDQQCLRKNDGNIVWILQDISIIPEPDTTRTNILGTAVDITLQKLKEEHFHRSAMYDGLTSLPNRSLFLDRLSTCFDRARRSGDYQFGILFLDLDRFKWVNDTFGHRLGDELLIAAAKRLSSKIRGAETVARLGGDEFAVLLNDVRQPADATRVASRIQAAFQNPFHLGDREISITVSIGIALSSGQWISEEDGSITSRRNFVPLERPEDLLWEADAVLYRAKALGRARYEIFDAEMQQKVLSMTQMEQELRHAVEQDQFVCVYQPVVHLKSGRITGFEPHIRWRHPIRGILPPEDFLLLAERMGLHNSIDFLLLNRACSEIGELLKQRPSDDLFLSINVSTSLIRDQEFPHTLIKVLQSTGISPTHLRLEIAESALIENFEGIKGVLNDLRTLGISIGLDDFGTGFASLRGLPEFPVDTLKLDSSLIRGMKVDQTYVDVVGTLISLGKSLGLAIVGLGVETKAQVLELRKLGCDAAQGNYFSEHVDIETVECLLFENKLYA